MCEDGGKKTRSVAAGMMNIDCTIERTHQRKTSLLKYLIATIRVFVFRIPYVPYSFPIFSSYFPSFFPSSFCLVCCRAVSSLLTWLIEHTWNSSPLKVGHTESSSPSIVYWWGICFCPYFVLIKCSIIVFPSANFKHVLGYCSRIFVSIWRFSLYLVRIH